MSTIAVTKIAIGYVNAFQRPSCHNCAQVQKHSDGYACKTERFFLFSFAVCKNHQFKVTNQKGREVNHG